MNWNNEWETDEGECCETDHPSSRMLSWITLDVCGHALSGKEMLYFYWWMQDTFWGVILLLVSAAENM